MEKEGINKFATFQKSMSQESFSDFFDYYFKRLVYFAATILKSVSLAEEVVLDVYLKLWQNRGDLSDIQNIETYLFVAVRNTALNSLKKGQKFHFDLIEEAHIQLADYRQNAEGMIVEKEMLDALQSAVNNLPAKCKIIFRLIREDGLNRNEVAKILDVSVKTVDNQVAIAVKKIADHLNIDLNNPSNSTLLRSFLLTL